jgi:hypothetical protein
MKLKNYIPLLIILAALNLNAQSFVKENKIWSVATFDEDHNYEGTEYYKFESDTIINGSERYKKVYVSNDQNSWWELGLLISENSGNVYSNLYEGNYEKQLYTFNIKEDDTLYVYFDPEANPLNVDSVVVKNILGVDRKYFYLSLNILWIEGIGSLQGPLEPFGVFLGGGFLVLLCVHEDGVLIYQNPDYPDCKVTSSAEFKSANNNLIELLPSPAGLLRLSLLNGSKGVLSLYSPEGKLLFKSQITEKETEICSPSEGLMLFRFVNEKGEVQTGKVFAMP